MKSYPGKPRRFNRDNSIYFLTFCTLKRRPLLHFPGIPEFLIEELSFYSHHVKHLIAYTVMPDHIHTMVEIDTEQSLSNFLRDVKKYTSVVLKRRIKLKPEDKIWQPGTMDHCIRTRWQDMDYDRHLSYIFYNSKKHLDILPKDFPYHNFLEFVEQQVFDIDFCFESEHDLKAFEIYEQ